jgi:hypothetical protein
MPNQDHEDLKTKTPRYAPNPSEPPPRDSGLYHGLQRPIAHAGPGEGFYSPDPVLMGQVLMEAQAVLARTFETGATRDVDTDKPDYEGFLSPLVLEAYGEYMHQHRKMKDGSLRASDNWQLGIPMTEFMKSGWRHFFDWWKLHRGLPARDTMVRTLCAILFNTMGYLHEYLKKQQNAS